MSTIFCAKKQNRRLDNWLGFASLLCVLSCSINEDVLDPKEREVVRRVLSLLNEQNTTEAQNSIQTVKQLIDQLVRLWKVVVSYPSIFTTNTVAGDYRNLYTLADAICHSNPYTIEACMPTRAVIGRAYVVAKFNFLRLLLKIVRHHDRQGNTLDQVVDKLMHFIRQSVLAIIAEDILVSISTNSHVHQDIRHKAVYLLAEVWENRITKSVKDFFPLVENIWEAKSKVQISYGALLGTSEILSLIREGCDPQVVDYFSKDQISENASQSLLELVFNATYEELETLRTYMKRHRKQVLSPREVAQILNVPVDSLHQNFITPDDLFFAFRTRQVNAYHRNLYNLVGPKKTAEEYLMLTYLEQTDIAPAKSS